jgi:hypothetical protein
VLVAAEAVGEGDDRDLSVTEPGAKALRRPVSRSGPTCGESAEHDGARTTEVAGTKLGRARSINDRRDDAILLATP